MPLETIKEKEELADNMPERRIVWSLADFHKHVPPVPVILKWVVTSSTPRQFLHLHQGFAISRENMVESLLVNQRSKIIEI